MSLEDLHWEEEDMEQFFKSLKNFDSSKIMEGFINQLPTFDDIKARSRPLTVDDLEQVQEKMTTNAPVQGNNLHSVLMGEIQKAGLINLSISEQLEIVLKGNKPLPEGDETTGIFKWEHKMLAIRKGGNTEEGLVDIFEVKEAQYSFKGSEFTIPEEKKTLIFQSIRDKDRMFILSLYRNEFQPFWFQYGDRVVCKEDGEVSTFTNIKWREVIQNKFMVQLTIRNKENSVVSVRTVTLTYFLKAYRFEDEEV